MEGLPITIEKKRAARKKLLKKAIECNDNN